jgi:pyruvate formate lyase activating enzyme
MLATKLAVSAAGQAAAPTAAGSRRSLKVGGMVPFTATDYPGKLAAVVFVQGCPWRCSYCHNPHLQLRTEEGAVPWPDVMQLLERRIGLIDAVVFSGGEATTDGSLGDAIRAVRELGFDIGLHTAGAYPNRLAALLPLLDWVGFDIKAPFDRYHRITSIGDSWRQARNSAELILASGIPYEFRTTIHPSLLPEHDILSLAQTLSRMGVQNYALQLFRPQGCNDAKLNAISTVGYPGKALVEQIAGMFSQFTLRPA